MRRLYSSFAVRLGVASVAWTAGLLYIAHLLSVLIMIGPEAFTRRGRIAVMLAIAVASMGLGVFILHRAIASFGQLQRRLIDVSEGRETVVTGTYVNEVQPVVSALNDLLAHQNRRVREAVAKAGDLAHGLKTPLAVIRHEADRAQAEGHEALAATLVQQVERMRRQIEYHLAHARAAASGSTLGTQCSVRQAASGVVRTLERLNGHRGLSVDLRVPEPHVVRCQREDVDEMLGNLLDNACKWAQSRIAVTSATVDSRVVITVDDDGPGIAAEMREMVLRRGFRADEAMPGSGLGLAIVRDLAEVYNGTLTLEASPWKGLRARLSLPEVPPGVQQAFRRDSS